MAGRPSQFTAPVRKRLLEAFKVGASRQTACHLAGISDETLRRWMNEGRDGAKGTAKAQFYAEILEAEAHPKERALGIIYNEMENNPTLAWKFIERREKGFAPPMPQAPAVQQGPVVIALALHDGSLPALQAAEVIEGEVVELESDTQA